jgi:hypothetical protein
MPSNAISATSSGASQTVILRNKRSEDGALARCDASAASPVACSTA